MLPAPLADNHGKVFRGAFLLGSGFTFDDEAPRQETASSLAEMRRLIEKKPYNENAIYPLIGEEEVNNDPRHLHRRYVIDFSDWPLRRDASLPSWFSMTREEKDERLENFTVPLDYPAETACDYPDLLAIVEKLVRPYRKSHTSVVDQRTWWRHSRPGTKLDRALFHLTHAIAISSRPSPHLAFCRLPTGGVFDHTLIVFAFSTCAAFAVLQSNVHELWARFVSSEKKGDLRYAPSDCFHTFPFPPDFESESRLEAAGDAYHAHRAALMIEHDEGLIKTYDRFHAPDESAPDIERLRALHHAMDQAVLRAYGWNDLAEQARPDFIEQKADKGKTAKTRLAWTPEFKDEVLGCLLALNAKRHAEDRGRGTTPQKGAAKAGEKSGDPFDS